MVSEEYEIDQRHFMIECSFVAEDLVKSGSPPVFITTDRQVKNFAAYIMRKPTVQLCVTFKQKVHGTFNKEPKKSATFIGYIGDKNNSEVFEDDDPVLLIESAAEEVDTRDQVALDKVVKKDQRFETKGMLKSGLEMCAMKHNFDYKVIKSDTIWWYIRCSDNVCNWRLRAVSVQGSEVFKITKYVSRHTCAPSNQKKGGKTASTKTIAKLIMPKYRCSKVGPSPIDVMQCMRLDQGLDISYSLAFDARDFAVNAVRGIPQKSYKKIPKYLYMLQAANPGTHYNFEIEIDGKFKYLFLAFGQSLRGYHNYMRKVIVVDGTFLKNKYKGVLLVATTLDGNNNLYPITFGIVDSENDLSWEWFMRELNVVISDDTGLTFVSNRSTSIRKAIETVYPEATHGICIHHLLNNVTTKYHGRSVSGLVADASKFYRPVDFEAKLETICNISPRVGEYLMEADVNKWARSQFPGFRYDVRTNNPAELINFALRAPKEYLVIHFLDSIREMLTRWFCKRQAKSWKHKHPLTFKVEKKIARRIKKGETFGIYMINDDRFHVVGDSIDCLVDLKDRTCTCAKYDLIKISCRHAMKAGLSVGRDAHSMTDEKYTTVTWRAAYAKSVNPISVPEDVWCVPPNVNTVQVYPPESRRQAGRRRQRRYETVEDKIQKSYGAKKGKTYKCSRCHLPGHNRQTCDMPI